jgi:hypothetical protein
MKRVRAKLSYANVVSTLCLILLVGGGTAFAAKSMIDGKSIAKNSLPGNRIASHSIAGTQVKNGALGGAQIDEGSLGQVPSAKSADSSSHAGVADLAHSADSAVEAAHAAAATNADHAGDATTLDGLSPSSFVDSSTAKIGAADPEAVPAAVILTMPKIGLTVETDGQPDFDESVVLRDSGPATLSVDGPGGFGVLQAGETASLSEANSRWKVGPGEAFALLQSPQSTKTVVLLHCWFPDSGNTGGLQSTCQAWQVN